MAEIRSLYGTTVAEILSDCLERRDEIEAIGISVLWKDGEVTAGHSSTEMASLALMVLALDAHQRRVLESGE
jgi:hypothetical protein